MSNRLESSEDSHTITGARDDDHPDEVRPADTNAFAEAVKNRELFWHALAPNENHVINFGPYYEGFFGLVRSAGEDGPPAVAFCRADRSFYTASDRQEQLHRVSRGQQIRSGKTVLRFVHGQAQVDDALNRSGG